MLDSSPSSFSPQRRRLSAGSADGGVLDASDTVAAALEGAARAQASIDSISDEVAAEVFKLEAAANERRDPLYADRARELSNVPRFWRSALLGHATLATLATKRDEAILEHLQDLKVEDAPDIASGYTITLTFGANPFFSNRSVEKRIRCVHMRSLSTLLSAPASARR